ncbi:phage adaptor protein [Herminiimonas contaminans]|uniref:Uncharacterized protein n=1 Tax=Herminiimonas contaminans TaxID=1111140 RepID=A0ABS0EYU4_9BURK|nr:hypothetical protein [Herminiimonas contaminans]MBF8179654.1 hypothetical protein [Herminiimonas contaminans]
MAGTMSRADLAASLKIALNDAAEVFVNAEDMGRLLDAAAQDFNRHRPRTQLGSFVVTADVSQYPVPADLYLFKSPLWGVAPQVRTKPWEKTWPGQLPRVQIVEVSGARMLHLVPAPTHHQVNVLGSDYRYYYLGRHVIDEDANKTTIDAGDRFLLLLRAQAEAMRELVNRNIKKPVQMRDGLNSAPKNMTPSAWCEKLLAEWEMKIEGLAA